jgi:hypothetical protein
MTIKLAIPPFARTCPASLSEPFENFSASPVLRRPKRRENRLDETKNPSNKIAQGKPPNPKMIVPSKVAAIAPLRLRACAHQASVETITARTNPNKTCIMLLKDGIL